MATERLTPTDGEVTKCDFEVVADSKAKRPGRVSMSRTQAIAVVIVFVAIVIMVGVLCFYETKRACYRKHALMDNDGNVNKDDDEDKVDDNQTDEGDGNQVTQPPMTWTHHPPDPQGPWEGRLPTNVIPESYDLHVKPYINDDDVLGRNVSRFMFEGHVVIRVRCDAETSEIRLHMSEIMLLNVSVIDLENEGANIYDSRSFDVEYSFLKVALKEALQPGREYNLDIFYVGKIRDDLHGFYRSGYRSSNGNTSWVALTHMEPVSARYVLPCFDEPTMKAVFNVSITHRSHQVALSNGLEMDVTDYGDGWSMTTFEPTPKMSTYLLAFVVGVLEYKETLTDNGIPLRVWSRPDVVKDTVFALESASSLLTYFEEYFDSPYQVAKMDMVCVIDFGAGGMENWGLVIYPERGMLYNPEIHDIDHKESVLTVVSHEMAHQWFGNLVTMKWWDDLWLNEGFGTYFGYIGADVVHPELKALNTMVSENYHGVLSRDSYTSSHPIKVAVGSPEEINQIFDDISYIKGAAVLRMLHDILGEDVFRRGIQIYLKRFSYSNAESVDLWDAFTEADRGFGDTEVWQVMDTWILQMGYPLINVTRENRTGVVVTQERYLANDQTYDPQESPFGYVWSVYISHTDNNERAYDRPISNWLTGKKIELMLQGHILTSDWYLFNIHAYGFLRVTYDAENWVKLINQLNTDHEAIPVLNRMQLIRDSLSLAMNGDLDFGTALDLTSYLRDEFNPAPWQAALGFFIFLRDLLATSILQGPYEKFLRDLTERTYQSFGLDTPRLQLAPSDEKTRAIILPIACKVRNTECTHHAMKLFANFSASYNISDTSSNVLEASSMKTLLCTAVREGGHEVWDFMWSLYTDPRETWEETDMWIQTLACSLRPWQIQRFMEYPLQSSTLRIRRQINPILTYVSRTPIGRSLAWDFLRWRWDDLKDVYGSSYKWRIVIHSITGDFNTDLQLKELMAFAASRDLGYGTESIMEAIHSTTFNINLYNRVYHRIKDWLETNERKP